MKQRFNISKPVQKTKAVAQAEDLQAISGILTRWMRVSTRLSTALSAYSKENNGLQSLVDVLSEEDEKQLRAIWPSIQSVDSILDAPADIPDLPEKSES